MYSFLSIGKGMSTNIYVLKLQEGKYYVGKSQNPMERYQEHLNGNGSTWTKKYKPIGVEKIIINQNNFDEDKWTKIYMEKYGIENVRGGAYVRDELPEFQTQAIKSEIWGSKDKCMSCGRKGHWANDCNARRDVTGKKIDYDEIIECEDCNKQFSSERDFENHRCVSDNACLRCGRMGHWADDCYARTHLNGHVLDEDVDDDSEDDSEGFYSDDNEDCSDAFYSDDDY
jgi:hypothetical protein